MRRSREEAAETRRNILATASRLFRARGIAPVSVADVMGALGLTVGGFYRHFASKEALVAEAIEAASLETVARHGPTERGAARGRRASALLDAYLSHAHRDHPEHGCPVAALCSEVAHEGPSTKEAFTRALGRLLAIVGDGASGESREARDPRRRATRRPARCSAATSRHVAKNVGRRYQPSRTTNQRSAKSATAIPNIHATLERRYV